MDEHALEGSAMTARRIGMAVAWVLAAPLLTGADDGARQSDEVAEVAVAYAVGFDDLLRQDPAEGERLGVSADELQALRPVLVTPVLLADEAFRSPTDQRRLDEALVPSDLWWVVLASGDGGSVVVSVQWPPDAGSPQAVGLNWVPAPELTAAMAEVRDPAARVVWLPDDAPVVIGTVDGDVVAIPIANEVLASRLGLPDVAARPIAVYTAQLRARLATAAALWDGADEDGPSLAGGGAPSLGDSGGPPLSLLVGPAVVLISLGFFALKWRGSGRGARARF
jgi:hypothetical protein